MSHWQSPNGLEQRVLARARAAGFASNDRIVVGFSGGRDSLALAATLRWAERKLDIEAVLVHVDHQLRASSRDEARRAANLADALGMIFCVEAIVASPVTSHPGVGMEAAARQDRYQILFDAATSRGAKAVAVAHHQEDQAETVLLHLLRGAGVHGAMGMAEISPSPLQGHLVSHDISRQRQSRRSSPWLWRPLLSEPRHVITAYVQEIGLEPIEDPSNNDIKFRRNALRHEALPLLEHHFPQAPAALARYGALAAEDDRALADLAIAALADIVDPGGLVDAASLRDRPLAIQRRLIRLWLKNVTSSIALSADRTDSVLTLVQRGQGRRAIEIGEGWTVRLERGMLRASRAEIQHEEGQ